MAKGTSIEKLVEGLNVDLRGEFQAVIMYRLYASMVQGPYRQELRSFFSAEIPEELAHAQILADKISALGGTPTRRITATSCGRCSRAGRSSHATAHARVGIGGATLRHDRARIRS